jgi:hypothetical protein
MIGQLVVLLIICVIIALIWWVCDYLPVPEPLNKLIKVVSVVIGCIAVIYILLAIAGVGGGLPQLK